MPSAFEKIWDLEQVEIGVRGRCEQREQARSAPGESNFQMGVHCEALPCCFDGFCARLRILLRGTPISDHLDHLHHAHVFVDQHMAMHDERAVKSRKRVRKVTDVGASGVPPGGSAIVSAQ